jgi:glycosyltransferase involved in cell wall biosynthesis
VRIEITKSNNKQYLLSINRIIPEKGIDDVIDVAVKTSNHIKVAGGDRFSPKSYVEKIIQKCKNSNGYALSLSGHLIHEYY